MWKFLSFKMNKNNSLAKPTKKKLDYYFLLVHVQSMVDTYLHWLTSIREPILKVVNEICWSPITISSSWKQTTAMFEYSSGTVHLRMLHSLFHIFNNESNKHHQRGPYHWRLGSMKHLGLFLLPWVERLLRLFLLPWVYL